MRSWLLLILFLLSGIVQSEAQVILGHQHTYPLDRNVYLLREKQQFSINDVWILYRGYQFTSANQKGNSIDKGLAHDVYWVAIPVKNAASEPQSLEAGIDNGGIFHLEYYLVSDSSAVLTHYTTGTNFDFTTRPIKGRHFFFPLTLAPHQSATIFFRVDMRGDALHLPLRIQELGRSEKEDNRLGLFYVFFSGTLAFVALFSFIAFLGTKDLLYLYYAPYVLSYCLCFLGSGNFDVKWLYPHMPFLATLSPMIYGLSLCMFMLLFMCEYLQLKSSHTRLYRLTRVWTALLIFSVILLAVAYAWSTSISLRLTSDGCCAVTMIGSLFVQGYCIAIRIRDRFPPAMLYGAALLLVIAVFLFYVLRVVNVVPDLIPNYIILPLGIGIEVLVLSFTLVYSYNFHRRRHSELALSLAEGQLNFSRQLIQLQEAEQKRIAQDLHDELGGNLAALKMNLQSLPLPDEKLTGNIIGLIDKASDKARQIAHNLMPPEFEKTTLRELLQTFFRRLNEEGKIRFHYYSSGEDNRLTKQDDLVVYRIVMELTNNIIKHSGATEATVQLIYYDTYLELMAEDNGKGFPEHSSRGMGLSNIESRVNFLQGKMTNDTGSRGTTVIIQVPYKT